MAEHGPFDTATDYFVTIASLHRGLVADGQIYPEYAKEAYLFYRLLEERVAPALGHVDSTSSFFLKHADDKGDHVLVDESYNITAVLDWQFARFAPAIEAFGPSLFTADLSNLYSNSTGLSANDNLLADAFARKGRQDLAALASSNELVRRFHFGLATGTTKSEVLGMIKAVLELMGQKDIDVATWIEREWHRDDGDGLLEKVKKPVADLEAEE